MYRQNTLLLIFIFLFLSCSTNSTDKTKKKLSGQLLPGYYGQWLYIKTNGTNVLPDLSRYNWVSPNIKRGASNALFSLNELGPDNIGGRTRAAVVDLNDPNRIIAGGVSGGIFISNDKGASWTAINDQQLTPSVTGMSQNPLTPNVIYYCTGEGSGNSSDIIGAGVFKSSDGGNTFSQLASTNNSNFNTCWSIKCSPSDTNILYVSTAKSGVWKSTDAGNTFTKVFNSATDIHDLEVLPDGSVLFAIKGGGVYNSPNGNSGTFVPVAGISSGATARGEIAWCKNFPKVVYAAISGLDNGYNGMLDEFYKSSDGGKTFKMQTNPNGTVEFPFTWYCLTMAVKDNDSNSIYLASMSSGYSIDGGASWNAAEAMHPDHHLSVNLVNDELLVGCDGGICIYNWSDFSNYTSLNNGLNITQFYGGAVSPHAKDVMGGCQDNGTNESLGNNKAFDHVYGGDGGYAFYHWQDQDIQYYSTQNGNVVRMDNGYENRISDNLPSSADFKWFIHPYDVSTYNSDWVIYPAYTNIYFSDTRGDNFITLGNITSGRLFASAFSAHSNPSVYAGGQNSLIAFDSVLSTNTKSYNRFANLPIAIRGSFLNCIKVIPGYRDKLYLAYSNISDSGRLYMATNVLSASPVFKNISGNLPKGLPVNWVECDPLNPEKTIFAGTDFGLYVSEDGGVIWIKDDRIPNVVISSIKISSNDKEIYFFTHGRGVFKGLINNSVDLKKIQVASKNNLINIYPNPASDRLNIKVVGENIGANWYIYDAMGKLILEGKLERDLTTLTTEKLNAGNYIFYTRSNSLLEHRVFSVIK